MTTPLQSRQFGSLPAGEPVEAWTLRGSGGLELEALTYGGIVTRLLAPDRNGCLADVVLGFNDLGSYIASRAYFGAIAGRVAGRITNARFDLDGKSYELAANDPPNHLHGGVCGFDRKLWIPAPVERADGAPSLRLACTSHDGEEGYPGTVSVTVTYTVTAGNVFLIETKATTDQPTPFNLTHHSYFNLAGESAGSIEDHELEIDADEFVPADEHTTLLGHLEAVTPANDFRQRRRIGDAIPLLFRGHGDVYRVRKTGSDIVEGGLVPAARLLHPPSGRMLSVSTTESYLQMYTGVSLDGTSTGKSGATYARHAGICLECEGYADGANVPALGDIILRPGRPQRHITAYAFSVSADGR